MELYERILCDAIVKEVLPALHINGEKLVELKSYQILQKIHEILSDDNWMIRNVSGASSRLSA